MTKRCYHELEPWGTKVINSQLNKGYFKLSIFENFKIEISIEFAVEDWKFL